MFQVAIIETFSFLFKIKCFQRFPQLAFATPPFFQPTPGNIFKINKCSESYWGEGLVWRPQRSPSIGMAVKEKDSS